MRGKGGVRRRRLLRSGSLLVASGVTGCLGGGRTGEGQGSDTTSNGTIDLGLPQTDGCPAGAAERLRKETDLGPRMESEYPDIYTGEVFLAHEHFYVPLQSARGDWELQGECLDAYVEFMDRNDISTALPFIGHQQLPALQEYSGRFAPFLNDFIFTSVVNDRPVSEWATMAETILDETNGVAGLGEFALFRFDAETEQAAAGKPPSDPLRADHPAMSDVYELAAERDLPVMLHPFLQPPQLGQEYAENPLESPEVNALTRAFDAHPETTFLVHGLQPIGDWIAELLADHENWYYDVSGLMNPHSWNPESATQPPLDFESHMTPRHIRTHAENAYAKWEPILTRAPEQVVVGFDMGQPWTIDGRVLESWLQVFRSVLGYLPEDAAENIAHRNAKRMIGSEP